MSEWWQHVERSFLNAGHVACYLGGDYLLMFWILP